MRRLLGIVGLTLIVTVGSAVSGGAETIKDTPEAVSLYARGKRLMRESNWLAASRLFEELAGRFPKSKNLDLFLLNRAKSQYYFRDYSKALAGFSAFVNRFPSSPFVGHVRYFAGNIHYIQGRANRAFNAWLLSYAETSDTKLSELLIDAITEALGNAESVNLSSRQFEPIEPSRRCELLQAIEAVISESSTGMKRMLVDCDLNSAPRGSSDHDDALDIAVILPLSGEMQSFGEELYRGVLVAADILKAEFGTDIVVTPFDTEGDPINAARLVKQIIGTTTDLVIGPLTSEASAVVSAVLADKRLPVIAPAATETGLTLLSESLFQLSPNIELEGVQMADYAALTLGADSAAIIVSTQRDNLRMARAFAERFESHGGTVVSTQYYHRREKDFGGFIRDIKATILGLSPDSTFFVDEFGDTLEPDGLPAHVDCLYMPGSADQLRLLLPQVVFYNLQATLLGSDGWGDKAIYSLGDNITQGAVFPSPFLQRSSSQEHLKFSSIYDARYGKQAPRLASLGYDAVRVAVLSIADATVSRESLLGGLSRLSGYEGAAASVSFGRNRENIDMPLYKIEAGQPVYLGLGSSVIADSTMRADQ